jgi:lauroyl/myristoyl acyltransferase
MMPAGPATVARRAGAPLITGAIYFAKGATKHKVVFRPAVELPEGGRAREAVQSATQVVAHELEQLIRQAPTQWHILQPNWPDDPPLRRPDLREWLERRLEVLGPKAASRGREGAVGRSSMDSAGTGAACG